jgi:hypothetical protein
MANPADVLMQLQTRMFAKQASKKSDIEIDDGILDEDQAAKRFIGHYVRRGQGEFRKGDRRDTLDVDDLNSGDVDDDYVTYRPMSLPYNSSVSYGPHKLGFEQLKHSLEQAMSPEEVGAQAAGGDPTGGAIDTPEEMGAAQAGQVPGAEPGPTPAMDPNAAAMAGMDPNLAPGMGQPMPEGDTSKTPSDLGRLYELKKIYTRLTVIEAYLAESSDITLIETRSIVSKAIELFEILSSNFSSFKPPRAPEETLDEIIVQYYRFLENVYEDVAKYYKKMAQEKEQNNNQEEEPKAKVKINVYSPV